MPLVFAWNFLCVYSFRPVEPLIIEHMMIMSSKSKTATEYKLHSLHKKLDTVNTVDTAWNFPPKKLLKNFRFLCQLEKQDKLLSL
jgi:hypothetical protein